MTKYLALWAGGASYGHSYAPDDIEVFNSLQAVKDELRARYDGWATITRPDGTTETVRTPAVEHDSEFMVWREDGQEPRLRVYFGRRGGIRTETF